MNMDDEEDETYVEPSDSGKNDSRDYIRTVKTGKKDSRDYIRTVKTGKKDSRDYVKLSTLILRGTFPPLNDRQYWTVTVEKVPSFAGKLYPNGQFEANGKFYASATSLIDTIHPNGRGARINKEVLIDGVSIYEWRRRPQEKEIVLASIAQESMSLQKEQNNVKKSNEPSVQHCQSAITTTTTTVVTQPTIQTPPPPPPLSPVQVPVMHSLPLQSDKLLDHLINQKQQTEFVTKNQQQVENKPTQKNYKWVDFKPLDDQQESQRNRNLKSQLISAKYNHVQRMTVIVNKLEEIFEKMNELESPEKTTNIVPIQDLVNKLKYGIMESIAKGEIV